MPYTDISQLPAHIKKYSTVIQRQWMHVWMTIYDKTHDEARAFKGANSVLKTRFKKKNSMEKNSRNDFFEHLVDSWLGNLKG